VTVSEQPQRSSGNRGARAAVAIIAVFFLLFGLWYLIQGFESGDEVTILFGSLIFFFFFSLVGSALRSPPVAALSRTVSVIKCDKCQYTEVRDFQKGDYMYKVLGKCKDCQGNIYIRSIYTVPIQKS
jgi:hypothetical protein